VRILSLETSSTAGSAAVLEGEEVLAQKLLSPRQRSAQSLAPAIREALAGANLRSGDIQLVAVTQGPGSFTGLRVGAATAKTFAYGVGAEIVGVNTQEAIAAQAPGVCETVWTLLDAHRGQLFVARYRLRGNQPPEQITPTHIAAIDDWLAYYRPDEPVTGPGISRIADRLPAGAAVVDSSLWPPEAATVGRLAWRHYQSGRRDDVWSFAPNYYRPSAAEEKHAG
jgi:tRNA threonylcarbamoyladenosine biosynthesis protein TsaB